MHILLYLFETGKLTAEQFVAICQAQTQRQETMGAIALRNGILTARQVLQILRVQSLEDASFGDIAVRLGLLTRQKIVSLLRLQQDMRPNLHDLAVELGFLSASELHEARRTFRRAHREREMEVLTSSLAPSSDPATSVEANLAVVAQQLAEMEVATQTPPVVNRPRARKAK